MKWISVPSLQRDFGLSRIASEALVGEQTRLLLKKYKAKSIAIGSMYLCGLLWGLGELDWVLPSLSLRWHLPLRLRGVALMVFSWFVLPQLLASDGILAAAATARADQVSTGASA